MSSRLQHFPVAWFAMIMGLTGLTLAWRKAEEVLQLGYAISPWLMLLATALFLLLASLYAAKIIKHRPAAMGEWQHPVRISFVPAFSIALILLSIAWLPYSAPWSKLLWTAGSALHLLLTLYVIGQWMHQTRFEVAHLNPAWFIPVVGNILVPIAGVEHAPLQVSWFFFSIGLAFWPLLLTMILYRLFFHGPLPERLTPTLFILIAPPAVGFLSYVRLTGGVDAFALVLYHSALFFTLLLLAQLPRFAKVPFFLSWWAYSFPLAAITIATLVLFQHSGEPMFLKLAALLLALATVVITGLFLRTALAVKRREICVQE